MYLSGRVTLVCKLILLFLERVARVCWLSVGLACLSLTSLISLGLVVLFDNKGFVDICKVPV
jgi:hypothetical protein